MRRVGKVVRPAGYPEEHLVNFFPWGEDRRARLERRGKSSLLRSWPGVDKDFEGEAIPQPNLRVGSCRRAAARPGEGLAAATSRKARRGAGAKKRLGGDLRGVFGPRTPIFEKLAEEQSRLGKLVKSTNVEHKLEIAADALRLPPWDMDRREGSRGRAARCALRLLAVRAASRRPSDPTREPLSVRVSSSTLERFPRCRGSARRYFSTRRR